MPKSHPYARKETTCSGHEGFRDCPIGGTQTFCPPWGTSALQKGPEESASMAVAVQCEELVAWEEPLPDALAIPCHIPARRGPRTPAWPRNQAGIPPRHFRPSHVLLSVLFLHPGAKGSAGAASPLIFGGAVLELGRKGKGVGVS